MPKEFHRSERVAELIHRVISDVVRNELRDPRVRLVTITDLQLSRDLTVAKVYFTSLDDSVDLDEVEQVLGKAAGFIRRRVGREVRLRQTPELRFFKDAAELHGRQISQLIDGAVSSDAARLAAADGGDKKPTDSQQTPQGAKKKHGPTS